MKKYFFVITLNIMTIYGLAQPGTLDPTFGNGGIVTSQFGDSSSYVRAIALQTDGKIVVGGYYEDKFAIARFNDNGSLDNGFGTNGIVLTSFLNEAESYDLAIQTDGKIVAVGQSNNGTNCFALMRYNTDGTLDNSFGTSGKVFTNIGGDDYANAVAIQYDGKIVAAGTTYMGTYYFALVRYNSNGAIDTTFGTDGMAINEGTGTQGWYYDVKIQPDQKIVASGYGNIMRFNPDGTLDNSFGTNGIAYSSTGAIALDIQQDGKIVVVGDSSISFSSYDFAVSRFDSLGLQDDDFGNNGMITTNINAYDRANSMTIQDDGKIIATGITKVGGNNNLAMIRYDSLGFPDVSFGSNGIVTTSVGTSSSAVAVTVQADGKILATGTSLNGTIKKILVARYNNAPANIEEISNNNIAIFPNPTTNKIYLNLNQLKCFQNSVVAIYDLQDRLLMRLPLQQDKSEIDIGGLPIGIYILKLSNSDDIYVTKILKE